MEDEISAPNRSILRFTGRDVVLLNQAAEVDTDGATVRDPDYGDIVWDDVAETPTKADIVYRGTPQFDDRASGIDDSVDIVAWVSDADAEYVTSGTDDETVKATRIDDQENRYVVRSTIDERNGLIRLHGEIE